MITYSEILKKASVKGSKKRNIKFLRAFFAEVKKVVRKQKRLVIPGFVTFTVKPVKARMIRNPQTSEPMQLPSTRVVKARCAKVWRVQ